MSCFLLWCWWRTIGGVYIALGQPHCQQLGIDGQQSYVIEYGLIDHLKKE
jgi:hypothetical protein